MHASHSAFDELRALGFRSFPVIARGAEATLCQELGQVADFLGIELGSSEATTLSADELMTKLDLVLCATAGFARQLTHEQLRRTFGGRKNRDFRGLACHVAYVAKAFHDAARGGRLGIEYYLVRAPRHVVSGEDVARFVDDVRRDLEGWWQSSNTALPEQVSTYWGRRPVLGVLERTTWHAAQHCRQLEAALDLMGVEPNERLGEAELSGLPLPENIFDDELPMGTEPAADARSNELLETMGPVLGLDFGAQLSSQVDLTSLESVRDAVDSALAADRAKAEVRS